MKVALIILFALAVVLIVAFASSSSIAVAQGCDPNYTGDCVPNVPQSDVDCAEGSGDGPYYVEGPVTVVGVDIYGLDGNGDGIGCESGSGANVANTSSQTSTSLSTTATAASSITCGLAHDRNGDGKADTWDRNEDGVMDAWDVNYDGTVDRMDPSVSCATVATVTPTRLPTTGAPIDVIGAAAASLMGVGGLLLRRKS